MIHLSIEGKSWPEVTEQLAGLIRENGQLSTAKDTEIASLRDVANGAFSIIDELREELNAADRRIAELTQQLDEKHAIKPAEEEAPTENPTTAAEPEQETSNSAESSETAGAEEDAPAPATTTEPEPEQPKYKKEDVRSFLAQAREKGVNITDVLKPFGGRFPSVDEKDYPALMEATKKALAEKGAK